MVLRSRTARSHWSLLYFSEAALSTDCKGSSVSVPQQLLSSYFSENNSYPNGREAGPRGSDLCLALYWLKMLNSFSLRHLLWRNICCPFVNWSLAFNCWVYSYFVVWNTSRYMTCFHGTRKNILSLHKNALLKSSLPQGCWLMKATFLELLCITCRQLTVTKSFLSINQYCWDNFGDRPGELFMFQELFETCELFFSRAP